MRGVADVCGCFPTGRQYPGIAHLIRTTLLGVAQELEPSVPWAAHPIVMIDTETTGREPAEDRIVEIAIVTGRDGKVLSRDTWLINPQRPIPEDSSAVHGIRDEDVRDKPTFADVCPEILERLAGAVPAAYNAAFDRGFLLAEIKRIGRGGLLDVPATRDRVVWLDPLVWARHLYPEEKSRKLTSMAELLGIELQQAHRATADAEAALLVMYKMAEQDRIPKGYGEIIQEQVRIARSQDEARNMWRRR
jgi:DNA polymerase-3 subunit epsilon